MSFRIFTGTGSLQYFQVVRYKNIILRQPQFLPPYGLRHPLHDYADITVSAYRLIFAHLLTTWCLSRKLELLAGAANNHAA